MRGALLRLRSWQGTRCEERLRIDGADDLPDKIAEAIILLPIWSIAEALKAKRRQKGEKRDVCGVGNR